MKETYLFLAKGFEEVEALTAVDVLRRADIPVKTVSITDSLQVEGAHGIPVTADCLFADTNFDDAEWLILPGGMPGSTNLRDSERVIALIRTLHSAGKIVSAICAAPIALHKAGVTAGRRITGYPGSEQMAPGLVYTGERIETDGGVVTGKGPGAAFDFAFALAAALGSSPDEIKTMKLQMFVL